MVLEGAALRDKSGGLRVDAIRRHIEARVRTMPRFLRRLSEVPLRVGRPLWVDDRDFAIERHVKLATVPPPGDRQTLLDLAAELLKGRLDRRHPLWELYLVDGLADDRVAIVEKAHHALVDGISGVELVSALLNPEPDARIDLAIRRSTSRGPGPVRRTADAMIEQLLDPISLARDAASSLDTATDRLASHASALGSLMRDYGPTSSRPPVVPFNRSVTTSRELRTAVLGLDRIAAVRGATSATINDVVLGAVTGALRRWLLDAQAPTVDLHAFIPVSTRHGGISDEPGNHVGGVMVPLPVGEPDPVRRLEIISTRMQTLKTRHEGDGFSLVLDALDHLPAVWVGAASRLVATQSLVNLVVTNVPGPRAPLYFLDAAVEDLIPVVPLGPRLGLGVAALSYCDRITVSLQADPTLCGDVASLADAIPLELDAMAVAVGAPTTRRTSKKKQQKKRK